MTEPITFLLPLAGAVLQFIVRQFKSVPEWGFYGLAVAICLGVWWLVTPSWWAGDWRTTLLGLLGWMAVHFTSLVGGTFLASNGAKKLADNGATNNLLVPVTNSK
jgi:hypothetical protein